MHSHARYTSESSNTTNASEYSEETDVFNVSDEDITSGYNPKTYSRQGTKNADEEFSTSATGFYTQWHREKPHLSPVQTQLTSDQIPLKRQQLETLMKNEGNTQEAIPLLRDDWVREECKRFFKSEYSKISKLKKSYKSLRKMFLILAILCIVLIICTISVLAVILVSFRMENRPNGNDKSESHGIFKTMEVAFKEFLFGELRSQRAKEIIRKHVFCDKCQERGRSSYRSKDFGDPDELECCQENAFNDFTTFKDTFTEKIEKHSSSLQEHQTRIIKLEDEVILFQQNRENKDVHRHSASSQSIFERTVLQSRVAVNNKLLNKLLNWKRSSMQLKGNAKSNSIEWQQDIKIGDIISTNNNGVHVQSGGTFYLYTNIQFKKDNCTDGEVFQYEIIEDRGGHNNAIAHVKQSCMGVTNSFSLSLNFQKVIRVPSHETASYYLNVISHSLSQNPWAHVFGILEI